MPQASKVQSKVCGLGSIEGGAGASLTACEKVDPGFLYASWMGRRPKAIGIEFGGSTSRGHPELSLDPHCMHVTTFFPPGCYALADDDSPPRGLLIFNCPEVVHT